MSRRRILLLTGVLLSAMAAWWIARSESGSPAAEVLDLAASLPRELTSLRIQRPDGDTLHLRRTAAGWTVNGYPALDSLVGASVAALRSASRGRLVARSASNHARLGLTDSAVRVQVGQVEFLVGAAGREGRFVRLPAGDEAFVFPLADLDPLVGREADWRDYAIATVDTAALLRIVVHRGGREVADVARSGSAPNPWVVAGSPADTAVMRAYLETLADLEATGFPADSFVQAADFEAPLAAVDLYAGPPASMATAPSVTLLFSTGLGHPDVLVRRSDSSVVYAIDRRRANLLTSTDERFRGRRPDGS